MRIFAVPAMALIFLGWFIYITFIKKTFKENKWEIFAGFTFIAIWAVILFESL